MATFETSDFSLRAIADSGQVFTWRELDRGRADARYLVASGARRCVASQRGARVTILTPSGGQPSASSLSYWRRYLTLDVDYGRLLDSLPLTEEQRAASAGIRVLRQDWWDVSVSFVISQNSNIPRIQHAVSSLMDAGGGRIPAPRRLRRLLGDESFASGLRLGYRLPYLRALADRAGGWKPRCLSEEGVPLAEQMAELEETPGVGPKVASCICLYGLGYLEAVPRDTWIKRAERAYGIEWDPALGGVQQQYVFAWIRGAAGALG